MIVIERTKILLNSFRRKERENIKTTTTINGKKEESRVLSVVAVILRVLRLNRRV